MSEDADLEAGEYSSWMVDIQAAIHGQRGSEVPCGACTACCTSFQFVHIEPDETDTLSCIPTELLFPAPRLPPGHVLLGYDERGHCPMLIDNRCSIYEHRPRTCRTYDCRVFPATGVEVEEDKARIARQARRWQFSFPTQADKDRHGAARAAARFLSEHGDLLPGHIAPANATQLAVLALQLHDLFIHRDEETGRVTVADPEPDVVRRRVSSTTSVPGVAGS